jgi:FMN phosphatase YigB (HAD superfamily)
MASRAPTPQVITFDCYGTLVQWHEVLLREIEGLLLSKGDVGTLQAVEVLNTFSRHSRRLEAERPHRLYKEILRLGFRSALDEHRLKPTDADVEMLASSIVTMGPPPQVPDALRRLKARYKLAIFLGRRRDCSQRHENWRSV